jgi:hypothetical protein
MNKPLCVAVLYLVTVHCAVAQIDTIGASEGKLILSNQSAITRSYAVYFTDSMGNRTSSADIWDREMKLVTGPSGEQQTIFDWKWVLKADQAPNGYTLFYIAQKAREVIKMKQFWKGMYRYKVKIY